MTKQPDKEAADTADGALLLLFVDRTYGPDRAAAIVAACARFIAERERVILDDSEPERDTAPATLFWCDCPTPTPNAEHRELCTWCKRLLRPTPPDKIPPFCSNCGTPFPNEQHICPRYSGQD